MIASGVLVGKNESLIAICTAANGARAVSDAMAMDLGSTNTMIANTNSI